MKGAKELHLNTAMMKEALQEYLEARFVGKPPKVVDVTVDSKYGGQTFVVKVEEAEEQPTA